MEMVELRNGSKEGKAFVGTIFMTLESLLENSPVAFYEAAQIALNPKHKPFGSSAHTLTERGLLENGKILHGGKMTIESAYFEIETYEGCSFKSGEYSTFVFAPIPVTREFIDDAYEEVCIWVAQNLLKLTFEETYILKISRPWKVNADFMPVEHVETIPFERRLVEL